MQGALGKVERSRQQLCPGSEPVPAAAIVQPCGGRIARRGKALSRMGCGAALRALDIVAAKRAAYSASELVGHGPCEQLSLPVDKGGVLKGKHDSCWLHGEACEQEAGLGQGEQRCRYLLRQQMPVRRFCRLHPLLETQWLLVFDSPEVIQAIAREHSIQLEGTTLFYYEAYEKEFDGECWRSFAPEPSFVTNVIPPARRQLEGFDVVTFSVRTSPECSPLSCNMLAEELPTNAHCLFPSFEDAETNLTNGAFNDSEPGPYRIFSVYSVDWSDG